MRRFLRLFGPAYLLSIIAVPLIFAIDLADRGQSPLELLWHSMWLIPFCAVYSLAIVVPACLAAMGVQWSLAQLLRDAQGVRLVLFTVLCALIGGGVIAALFPVFVPVGATAGGLGAYLASRESRPTVWLTLVITGAVFATLAASVLLISK